MLDLENYERMLRAARAPQGRPDGIERIVSAAAWRADEIGGKAGLSRALEERELVAFEAMLAATRGKPTLDMAPCDFDDPRLRELGRQCHQALVSGRGAVILTGLDVARFGVEGYQRLYWYLGQLIGEPVAQSERGDRLGYVRQEKDNFYGRTYLSNAESRFHNDYHELMSLACIQAASEGGESGLASGLAVHNILLDERPDLLAALYQGWYDGILAFYKLYPPRQRWPREHVPTFCEQDGVVTLHGLATMFYELAAEERGEALPPLLEEAVNTARDVAARPGVGAWFVLQPGEMLFWHNWSLLHARKAFFNAPGKERVLMRLWMHAREGRPAPAFVGARARLVDQVHADIRSRNEAKNIV